MRVTFRSKLILLTICAALTISLMVVVSEWRDASHRLDVLNLERRLVPRIALTLKLQAEFVNLGRAFQDAAAAQDLDGLKLASKHRSKLFDLIAESGHAVDPAEVATLRWRIKEYYETSMLVSQRLISETAGEDSVHLIATMQEQKRLVEESIQSATAVDQNDLGRAFGSIRASSLNSSRVRIAIAFVGLASLVLLWFWASRQMLRGLSSLSTGLARFSTGSFDRPIRVDANDELRDVARGANTMAANLKELASHRNRTDWLKSGQVELSTSLRGNISLSEVANLAAKCLVGHIDAVAAAVYLARDDETLWLCGHYAYVIDRDDTGNQQPRATIGVRQGLLGEAFASAQLKVVSDLPADYFQILSGLGSGYAPHLLLFPISMDQKTIGVVEFALSKQPTELEKEYLASIQSTLFIAFQSAQARATMDRLLVETRQQAERLAAQEEELRLSNQELSAQQEELRKSNEELEQQQLALSQRNRELDQARKRVQEKVEELGRVSVYKSQFLANMSHELRTPLNSMLLLSHLLAENEGKNLTDKQVEYCRTVHSAGEDLLELINQVLDLSKIEAGKQEVHIEQVELLQVASSIQKMFEPVAKEKDLEFVVSLDPACPTAFPCDRLRLERILTNLLGNAIKFTEKGQVKLRIEEREVKRPAQEGTAQMLAFVVSDTGIGIAPDNQARAFRPFEQIEASTARRYQGTGLGLAIVRESVVLLGGEISLSSEPGKGSTFTCLFPLAVASGKTALVAELEDGSSTKDAASDAGPLHLLVIEDDPVLAEQLLSIIEGRGLSGKIAPTGALGLTLAKAKRPAGIILDVKLPDVDGWTVMERLQSDPVTKHIPVHFLSALDAPENGLVRGAVGYLTKPATRQELSDIVRSLVPSDPSSSQNILVVEDSTNEGKSIVALLSSEGLAAEHVTSAEEALARLECDDFGCIILDLGLKEMDGLGFLEVLRTRPDLGEMSVIVHTGRSLSRKESNHLQEYAQAIVVKDGRSSVRLLEEVRLFVHHVKDRASAHDAPMTKQSVTAEPDLAGLKLLLVEDDMRTVYSLSALLQSRGCEVLVAENGREALALLEQHEGVQCVLTDIMMPEMDGYELMGHLRANKRFKELPIVALTAKAMSGERERCLAAGASEYLSKPVDGAKLLSVVHAWTSGDRSA